MEIRIPYAAGRPDWEKAQFYELLEVVSGKAPQHKTRVALAWNESGLFAKYICEDDGIVATMTGFNDPIYDEDVVELFLDDDGNPATYYEFNVSPINTHLQYVVLGADIKFARIKETMKSQTTVTTNSWTADIFIPAAEFVYPPQKGRSWRGNFYRIDRSEADEYSALAPTGEIAFHRPDFFVKLIFE